jgi:hypothetical protein
MGSIKKYRLSIHLQPQVHSVQSAPVPGILNAPLPLALLLTPQTLWDPDSSTESLLAQSRVLPRANQVGVHAGFDDLYTRSFSKVVSGQEVAVPSPREVSTASAVCQCSACRLATVMSCLCLAVTADCAPQCTVTKLGCAATLAEQLLPGVVLRHRATLLPVAQHCLGGTASLAGSVLGNPAV